MSSDRSEARAIANGAILRLRVPEGASPEPEGALPAIDVSNLPGAVVRVRVGFGDARTQVRAVCATAPSRGWAPGVEQIVTARASQIARAAIGGEVTRFDASDTLAVGPRFEQRFEADVKRGGGDVRAMGKHVIGFSGEARDAIACSVVCTEAEGERACEALVEGATSEGAWVEAPPASLVVRGIFLAADRPMEAMSIAGALALATAALVIAKRPRPRPI